MRETHFFYTVVACHQVGPCSVAFDMLKLLEAYFKKKWYIVTKVDGV